MSLEFDLNIMHDLKEPIRSINALATIILQDTSINDEIKNFASKIKDKSTQLNEMIQAIRDLSSVGQDKEIKEIINLNDVINSIFSSLSPPGKIKLKLDNDLPILMIKRSQINQIFENLLRNSINFSDKNQGIITVFSKESGNYWEICISDNGQGIKEYFKPKIFNLFYSTPTVTGKKGIGLGLALVKRILSLNGGQIWVESEEGKGSKFYFTLNRNKHV